jgi:hypothetical protein
LLKTDSKSIWGSSQTGADTRKEHIMRFNEEHIDQLTTRQYWEYEDSLEDLLDGWRACRARLLEKEEADINNNQYRQLRSVSRHRYIHVERGGEE